MKANCQSKKQTFEPVTICLTFESQLELDAFSTLFNTRIITDFLEKNGLRDTNFGKPIREAAEAAGGDVQGFNQSTFTPLEWHRALRPQVPNFV